MDSGRWMPDLSRVGRKEGRRNGAVSERIARLRIELQELEPKIWQRIDMPLSTTLEALHEAIQMTMGWTFFAPLGIRHRRPLPMVIRLSASSTTNRRSTRRRACSLGTVIARGVERFVYTYDYGDNLAP